MSHLFFAHGSNENRNDDDDDDGKKALVGYGAAVVACLAFGSFAVPIKSARANKVDVDPLVMQSYKTGMCFLTCWILLLFGEPFSFTPWGLLSGLFWVPGGTAGIYAVRSPVGLAMSQSIWSPLKLLAGFTWGILIFHESVRSKITAFVAILLMMFGLCGMSFCAVSSAGMHVIENADDADEANVAEQHHSIDTQVEGAPNKISLNNNLSEPLLADQEDFDREGTSVEMSQVDAETPTRSYNRTWRLGFLCAIIDGAYGGSILVPMHFAKAKSEGLGFVISFAVGAMTVLSTLWILRFTYACVRLRSMTSAYQSLPGFHLSTMWLPGSLAGLLWSIGNIASIVCVSNLGEGVGYCVVQSQMLVAGLWGVFYYREVQGFHKILCWLCCAFLTVAGVLLLSHEHVRRSN